MASPKQWRLLAAGLLAALMLGNGSTSATGDRGSPVGRLLPSRMPHSTGGKLFVSLTGSDGNPCKRALPCRTVARALQLATPGVTVYMRGGAYPDYVDIENRHYSDKNPVTVTAYPGETVTITGNSSSNPSDRRYLRPAVQLFQSSGIRLHGLRVSNAAGTGVKVLNSSHVDVDRMFIGKNAVQGILVTGAAGIGTAQTWSEDVQIWNSTFTSNGGLYPTGPNGETTGNWDPDRHDHSIYYGASSAYGTGVRIGTEGGVIANNVIYDQDYGFSMRIGDAARGLLIVNNTIDHSYVNDPAANRFWGQAISVANASVNDGFQTQSIGVYNNLITNSAAAVYGSGWVSMPSNRVDYNLSWNISTTQNPDCAPDCNFNPRYGAYFLYASGTHNRRDVNPRFVSAASHDYHLQSGSLAIGKADPAYVPKLDKDGKRRGAASSVGAYEPAGPSGSDKLVGGSLAGVQVTRAADGRRVSLMVTLQERLSLDVQLLRRGKALGRKKISSLQPGKHRVAVRIGKRISGGGARLRLTLEDARGNTKVIQRAVRLPRS